MTTPVQPVEQIFRMFANNNRLSDDEAEILIEHIRCLSVNIEIIRNYYKNKPSIAHVFWTDTSVNSIGQLKSAFAGWQLSMINRSYLVHAGVGVGDTPMDCKLEQKAQDLARAFKNMSVDNPALRDRYAHFFQTFSDFDSWCNSLGIPWFEVIHLHNGQVLADSLELSTHAIEATVDYSNSIY